MITTPLKSIEEEKQDCIKAFTDFPSKFAWCCHHEEHCEPLAYSFMDRVNYILLNKPENEQALRFRNFRPAKDEETEKPLREAYVAQVKPLREAYEVQLNLLRKAYRAQEKPLWEAFLAQVKPLHEAEWPDNSWNGTSIFEKT